MLQHAEATLPSRWYTDPEHFAEEIGRIWYREWICVGHASEWNEAGQFQRVSIGDQQVIVTRDREGAMRAFHTTARPPRWSPWSDATPSRGRPTMGQRGEPRITPVPPAASRQAADDDDAQ